MEKKVSKIAICIIMCIILLSGCSNTQSAKSSLTEKNISTEPADKTANPSEKTIDYTEKSENDKSTDKKINADYDNMITIDENMYVAWINEIYTNSDSYIGKTISIEGMFTSEVFEGNGLTYYYVYRVGPGCCGNDGSMCGFEFTYDGDMPKENDWISVTGVLDSYEDDGVVYLTLDAVSVEVKDERGSENVN